MTDYLIFGLPLGIVQRDALKSNATSNHTSAFRISKAIRKYINFELSQIALLGPFQSPPHSDFI